VEDEAGDFEQALLHWRKLEPQLQGDEESLAQIQRLISRAEKKLGKTAPASALPSE
jgi:cytochrome c-type biogenesis protein CcmH/NrfG